MKIKFLRSVSALGIPFEVGTVHEVSDATAKELIALEAAELTDAAETESKPETESKAAKKAK